VIRIAVLRFVFTYHTIETPACLSLPFHPAFGGTMPCPFTQGHQLIRPDRLELFHEDRWAEDFDID